ncbi:helix-turn-helix family protein [Orientia tsutsugamushi str. UT76]|uniref:Transcriptional regulator n=1 Tax=Orientia tsutsugamushi TaxID=784 RepID=A0A2U3REY7_ORITS|nr:helix-turn-helix transcriptional regulator [Orientia tsutsugamushi]KJV90761.1 helix-turn-helix family protein [Orientia tsutsugamushi str. UT76]SPR11728.1 transcriptional regulator [Orientia tsutsugamushi]
MGNIGRPLQKFLKAQMKVMTRIEMAQGSGVSYTEICALIAGAKPNPRVETVVKLANFFKKPVDEILNRKRKCTNTSISSGYINPEEVNHNIKQFLVQFMQEKELRASELSTGLGHSIMAVSDFISGKKESIGSTILANLADKYGISLHGIMGGALLTQEITEEKEASLLSQRHEQKLTTIDITEGNIPSNSEVQISKDIHGATSHHQHTRPTVVERILAEGKKKSGQKESAVARVIAERQTDEETSRSSSMASRVMDKRTKDSTSKNRNL